MVIRFKCPKCSKVISVKDENAGKKGRCPRCKEIVVVPKAETSEAQPTRGVVLTQDPNTHQENKQPGQPNAKVNVSDNVRSSKKWKYGIGVLCVLVVIGLWRGCSERALEKESINGIQQQWDETTTEINRIKKDDIDTRAAKRSIAKKPSSAKSLKSMTIGQVRQLRFDWIEGKLPEQQVEGADEIRKELASSESTYKEREVEGKNRLSLLRDKIPDSTKIWSRLRRERDAKVAEYKRSAISRGEFDRKEYNRLDEELRDENNRILKEAREREKRGEEEYRALKNQLGVQQREFYNKKISPLRVQLAPDKSVKTFYKVFGKPKDKSLIGDRYYFQYRCKDGLVILEIDAYRFDHNQVVIWDVAVL